MGKSITITNGLVDAASTPTLMRLGRHRPACSRQVRDSPFSMDDFEQAYDVFADSASNGALKVVLTREEEADE